MLIKPSLHILGLATVIPPLGTLQDIHFFLDLLLGCSLLLITWQR
jgi:hypothetical protein